MQFNIKIGLYANGLSALTSNYQHDPVLIIAVDSKPEEQQHSQTALYRKFPTLKHEFKLTLNDL